MSDRFRIGQLVAFVGADEPAENLFDGQPGVVLDLGPDDHQPAVSFEGGRSIVLAEANLRSIEPAEYQLRAEAIRANAHPLTGASIEPLDIASPSPSPDDIGGQGPSWPGETPPWKR